jgi:hypothetical protein
VALRPLPHQQGHVDDRDRVGGAQFPSHRRKVDLSGVVIVEEDVGRSHEIESDDEYPKEWPYPNGEKRQDGEHPGCEVAVSGERGEASLGQKTLRSQPNSCTYT